MSPEIVLFVYHTLWGFAVAVTVSLFWAKRVATQATVVRDTNSSAQIVTYDVDNAKFLRCWALYAGCGTGVTVLVLIVFQVREQLVAAGYVG